MNVSAIEKHGWRQGRLFSRDDTDTLCRQLYPKLEPGIDDRLILISQDCDVLHTGDSEPIVDIALAKLVGKEEKKECDFGKHIRLLRIHASNDEQENDIHLLVASATRRHLSREVLCDHAPSKWTLNAQGVIQLRNWFAKRFTRAALPDNFNQRFKKPGEKIANRMKQVGDILSALLIRMSSYDELDENQEYIVSLLGVMPHAMYGQIGNVELAQTKLDECVELINTEPGLKHQGEASIKSDKLITVHERGMYVHLDLDYLSYRTSPNGPVLPNG